MDDRYETTVDLDAEPELVWEALTDPEGVEAWLGQGSTLEPVDGGSIDTSDPETGTPRHGRVDHVDPERQLRYTWWPAPPGDGNDRSTVTIELIPTGAGTRLVVTETPLVMARASVLRATGSWAWRLASVELRCISTPVRAVAPR